ncbi:hypothetical protein N657DRAFT_88271 [Parathielavia appendiculata]|uniref:Uncharacterized protein n=1 Tax=Parathielavia appendiculata TaxID=2587402 RepID=A0AAN6Z949_9PEZI|nr:hypothetical protein N657DRAFT_88271 [Parathielavia appendiculata]
MAGKSDRKAEDHAEENWSASESSTRALPSLSTASRSITPKGPLFPNLGEAHQAITSRLASHSAGRHVPDKPSQPSSSTSFVNVSSISTGSADSQPSATHMEFARPNYPAQRCLTPFFDTSSSGDESAKTPTGPSPVVSPLASSSGGNSVGDSLNDGAGETYVMSDLLGTGEIIEVMYDECYTPPLFAQSTSSAKVHQSKAVGSDEEPSNKCQGPSRRAAQSTHVRSTDIRRANTDVSSTMGYWHMHPADDEPSPISLPKLPKPGVPKKHPARGNKGVLNISRPVLSVQTIPNCQDATNKSADAGQASRHATTTSTATSITSQDIEDFVICGRLPPQPGHDKPSNQDVQESENSHGESSNAGGSTDSDEDPFKYDRGSFTGFLQPSREREVSAALRCVSDNSIASVSGLLHLASPQAPTPLGFQSNNPFAARLQSYQTPAVGYDWGDEDGLNEVRIPVVRSPPPVPPNSPVQHAMNLSDFVEGLGSQRHRNEIFTLMSDQADWETVTTSVGQFDSNRALASSTGLSGSHPVKVTGSSIADYSDTSSVHVPQFDAFSSTEKIMELITTNHPLDTHGRRMLKGPGRPVFPPKPRIHRVNGYLQNPRRMFIDTTTGSSGTSVRSALVERLTASIRSRSARKQAYQQNSQLKSDRWSRASGFESLDSISSTYSDQPPAMDGFQATNSTHESRTNAVVGCKKQQGQETTFGLLTSPIPKEPAPVHLKGHQPAQPNHTQRLSGFKSPTLFSFPLISLQEAAKRAKIRALNDGGLAVTSGTRTRKNSSMDPSKATQRTTHPTPHIMKPIRDHPRRPTSASILGISENHRGYANSQENLIMGHERGISNVTSYKSATPLVAGRSSTLSRAFRNPFEAVGSGVQRNTHPYPGHTFIFDTPPTLVQRDKRNAARAAAAAAGLGNNMSPSLRQIAALEAGASFGALATDDSVYLSWEARKRREAFYYLMCALAVFPLLLPLFWLGKFDSALSWITRGETGSFTPKQRSRVLFVGVMFGFIWVIGIAVGGTVAALNADPELRATW